MVDKGYIRGKRYNVMNYLVSETRLNTTTMSAKSLDELKATAIDYVEPIRI